MGDYIRVLPRDLFNEANLLKCYGALWIALDNLRDHRAIFDQEDVDSFDIDLNENTGGIILRNVTVSVDGEQLHMERPINSREPWPLYVEEFGDDPDFDPIPVFTGLGELSADFLRLIGAPMSAGEV